MPDFTNKIKLHGFNNLTKTLSFNLYDICYAKSTQHREEYMEYINENYNALRLSDILTTVAKTIDATILNISHQDYDPRGASVTMLVAEKPLNPTSYDVNQLDADGVSEIVLAHLDKSHITVHTYPESHPENGLCTFRADIDVSTCGLISPLKALNYLLNSFESDVVTIDYRVRGFTRRNDGEKIYIDHKISSIQNYIDEKNKEQYEMIDVNIYQENIFHTKMMLKNFDLNNYLFAAGKEDLNEKEIEDVTQQVKTEMQEIFYSRCFGS